MPTYRLKISRASYDHGVVDIDAPTAAHAVDLWEQREDDDAFGCEWRYGDAGDDRVDAVEEVAP